MQQQWNWSAKKVKITESLGSISIDNMSNTNASTSTKHITEMFVPLNKLVDTELTLPNLI